jgi:hypothetical protein
MARSTETVPSISGGSSFMAVSLKCDSSFAAAHFRNQDDGDKKTTNHPKSRLKAFLRSCLKTILSPLGREQKPGINFTSTYTVFEFTSGI